MQNDSAPQAKSDAWELKPLLSSWKLASKFPRAAVGQCRARACARSTSNRSIGNAASQQAGGFILLRLVRHFAAFPQIKMLLPSLASTSHALMTKKKKKKQNSTSSNGFLITNSLFMHFKNHHCVHLRERRKSFQKRKTFHKLKENCALWSISVLKGLLFEGKRANYNFLQ